MKVHRWLQGGGEAFEILWEQQKHLQKGFYRFCFILLQMSSEAAYQTNIILHWLQYCKGCVGYMHLVCRVQV